MAVIEQQLIGLDEHAEVVDEVEVEVAVAIHIQGYGLEARCIRSAHSLGR